MTFLAGVGTEIVSGYTAFMKFLPLWASKSINLFLIALVLVLYSVAIWKFYRFIARKNILELNLKKYNNSEHPVYSKTIAVILYTLEYIIILPFVVLFWYVAFVAFMLLVTQGLKMVTILTISATLIIAIRMTAYYKKDLSKDLAKMIPFTILGIALERGGTFNLTDILSNLSKISTSFELIITYLVVIFVIEVILRIIENIFITTGMEEPEESELS